MEKMSDPNRRYEQNSPRSSPSMFPRGSRSPAVPRQDSSGTLKTTISLGKNPAVIQKGPFYLMKETPEQSRVTGSTNLMSHNGLEHSYNKFCGKKVKEELSAFLPMLPGNIDMPGIQDNSSLRSLIDKPPIIGKEILPLTGASLAGFRLHPGPLPEQYRLMSEPPTKKHKHKRHKKELSKVSPVQEMPVAVEPPQTEADKKHKKPKRSEEERRKKKKEKRKKKKQSPEHMDSTELAPKS